MYTSNQQAYRIGQAGGTVNTNGLPYQERERIDAAVNAGKQAR